MPQFQVLSQKSVDSKDFTVHGQIVQLYNSFLLMLSDQDMFGIGTISLATPPSSISNQAVSSPFNLFGMKHTLLANLLGKMVSKQLKMPVLSLILIKTKEIKPKIIMEACATVVKQLLEEIQKKTQDKTGS